MIYSVGKIKLDIPESGTERKIRTPSQVVPYRDVAETCRTLDAVLSVINCGKKPKIVDAIARSGFWCAVSLTRWTDCELIINDKDENCCGFLKSNFPNHTVLNNDVYSWTPPESDILILDFDAFTLRKLPGHSEVLSRVAKTAKWVIIADSTCFGFKFGNLRHYGVKTEEEYYELLAKETKPIVGKNLIAVSAFMNAAMVLYGNEKGKITHIQPSDLFVSRGHEEFKPKKAKLKGFGLCG